MQKVHTYAEARELATKQYFLVIHICAAATEAVVTPGFLDPCAKRVEMPLPYESYLRDSILPVANVFLIESSDLRTAYSSPGSSTTQDRLAQPSVLPFVRLFRSTTGELWRECAGFDIANLRLWNDQIHSELQDTIDSKVSTLGTQLSAASAGSSASAAMPPPKLSIRVRYADGKTIDMVVTADCVVADVLGTVAVRIPGVPPRAVNVMRTFAENGIRDKDSLNVS
eukprot:ANDGO_00571.mRNA.1 hypothetical protein